MNSQLAKKLRGSRKRYDPFGDVSISAVLDSPLNPTTMPVEALSTGSVNPWGSMEGTYGMLNTATPILPEIPTSIATPLVQDTMVVNPYTTIPVPTSVQTNFNNELPNIIDNVSEIVPTAATLRDTTPVSNSHDFIANIESSNSYTAKNPNSSAYGKYQFLKSTYSNAAKALGMTYDQVRTPEGQEKAMNWLRGQNRTSLNKYNIPINNFTEYGAHQLGAAGFNRAYKGKPTAKDLTNMRNNTPAKYRTGHPYEDWMSYWKSRTA